MTDDLSMLPEGLRRNVEHMDFNRNPIAWSFVRAELLRLARENAELHKSAMGGYEDGWHALRNERDALKTELAALKATLATGRYCRSTRNGVVRTPVGWCEPNTDYVLVKTNE